VNAYSSEETLFKSAGTYNVNVEIDDEFTSLYVLEGNTYAVASIKSADIIITADDATKVYGDENPSFTVSYDLLGDDAKDQFIIPEITCVADETSAVGYYDINLSYDGYHGNDNYNVILVSGQLSVTKADLIVTADDKSVSYGSKAREYTVSYSGFKGDDGESDLDGELIVDCEYEKGTDEGTYSITPSGLVSDNYQIEFIAGQLTVTAKSYSGSSGASVSSNEENTINLTEVPSEIFQNKEAIKFEADVDNAFGKSVDVRITEENNEDEENDENDENDTIFRLVGGNYDVHSFDISLYTEDTDDKIQPNDGYSVKITLPIPDSMLDTKSDVKVVCIEDGSVVTLESELVQNDGIWCVEFEAEHFSPYALIVEKEWVNSFDDVDENDWFYNAVNYVNAAGIMVGTSDGTEGSSSTFDPYLETTRGMIVTILYNIENQPEVTTGTTFEDVLSETWYYDAVVWGSENEIVKGFSQEIFKPNDNVTREQLAAILYRYAAYKGYDTMESGDLSNYEDDGEISTWALHNVRWAVAEKLILGLTDSTLDAKGYATRAQVATIIMRFLQNVAE
jgi:hypothetical protein